MSTYTALSQIAKSIRPQLLNSIWQMPKLSAMRVARLRKESLQFGTVDDWKWEWDCQPAPLITKIPKGRLIDNVREERAKNITARLSEMPSLIAEEKKRQMVMHPELTLFQKMGLAAVPKTKKEEKKDIAGAGGTAAGTAAPKKSGPKKEKSSAKKAPKKGGK